MRPVTVPLLLSIVHLTIVTISVSAPDGTAPISEFAGVFDPSGDNLGAMSGMMKVREGAPCLRHPPSRRVTFLGGRVGRRANTTKQTSLTPFPPVLSTQTS